LSKEPDDAAPRPKLKPERANARLGAVQALYQMDVSGKPITEVQAEFEAFWLGQEIEGDEYKPAETPFFRDLLAGVLENQRVIDRAVDEALAKGWPLTRIDTVMRATLRAGVYELMRRKDVPARVVIKEYVDVAGSFFEREEAGMVNAVLDNLARKLRPDEF
jgi:N utilization substance protein B